MGGESSNLVSESLCLDGGHIVNDSLIYMEVVGQPAQDDTPVIVINSTKGRKVPIMFYTSPQK